MDKKQYIGIALIAFALIVTAVLVYNTIQIYYGEAAPVSLDKQLSPQAQEFMPVSMINLAYWGIFSSILTAVLVFPTGYFGLKLYQG